MISTENCHQVDFDVRNSIFSVPKSDCGVNIAKIAKDIFKRSQDIEIELPVIFLFFAHPHMMKDSIVPEYYQSTCAEVFRGTPRAQRRPYRGGPGTPTADLSPWAPLTQV